ncbi:hypothetical protein NTH42_003139 [Vibrio fluvialis]|nr:hypothetical protein [Vibrio fluvialis]
MKMSDVSMFTCRTTGISELYWDGGRICIELGNDIDEVAATKIFESVRDYERLTSENERLREALQQTNDAINRLFAVDESEDHNEETNARNQAWFAARNNEQLLTELEKDDLTTINKQRDELISGIKSELLASVSVIFRPHIEGVFAVIEQRILSGKPVTSITDNKKGSN